MWLIRSILDHFELDWRESTVAVIAIIAVVGIVSVLVLIDFSVWRLAHPEAPWWTWSAR